MKRIRIGIPRALIYYRDGVLWKNFFEALGCKVVLSPKSSIDILKLGVNNTPKECCLAYKMYIGHAMYLSRITDYVLIPIICNYGKKDRVCQKLHEMYDNIKYIISKQQIIEYNIEHTKFKYEFFEIFRIGLQFNMNPLKIFHCYIYAKNKQKNYKITKENEQKHKLQQKNKKVLMISNFYNIEDQFISKPITEYLNNENITVIYSNQLEESLASDFAEYFSDTINLKYVKEAIGSLYYYRYQISGIIYVSSHNCPQDTIIHNLSMKKNKYLPSLNIIIDDNNIFLKEELDKFINIVKGENNE